MRVALYQSAAELAGTKFERADPAIRSNIAGGITKHPLAHAVAETLATRCRAAGGEAKLLPEDRSKPDGFAFVYLSGCSFDHKDHL